MDEPNRRPALVGALRYAEDRNCSPADVLYIAEVFEKFLSGMGADKALAIHFRPPLFEVFA